MALIMNKIFVEIQRTNSDNPDFRELIHCLDQDLAEKDGKAHIYYSRFNKIDKIKHAVVAYINAKPVGCGGLKVHKPGTMEIKRMYVLPESRGKGIAIRVLEELENWARELSCNRCILETGKKQPEATALYKKSGYEPMPNYGQYANVENSLCFEKTI